MSIERGIAIGDNHGSLGDILATKELFAFMREFKPVHRIHLGDCWDWYAIRSRANENERAGGIQADTAAGKRFLEKFQPTVFLNGNHEARLYHLFERSTGIVAEYAEACLNDVKKMICRWAGVVLPYHVRRGVYKLGDVSFVHGFSIGVNAARDHALWFGNCVMGHLHRCEVRRARRSDGATCYVAGGCYHEDDLTYAHERTTLLEWQQGAVCFEYNTKTGAMRLWHQILGQNL